MNVVSRVSPAGEEDRGAGRLTICSVLTSLTTGGAENLVLNLGAEFAERDIDHVIVALCDAETLGNSADTESAMKAAIASGGGRFVSLGLGRRRGVVKGALALARCRRELRPQLWHFHTARAVSMAAVARLPEPSIMTHHNSRLTFPPAMFKIFDTAIASYVAISPETGLIYRKYARRPVRHIPNAAGGNFTAKSAREGMRKPAQILSVGAVSAQKNYRLLIDTAVALRDRVPPDAMPVFSIAGAGEGIAQFQARVAELGLERSVIFLGERHDIRNLLSRSDLLLNTSRYEGLPIAMIEAMSMGLPVVATPVAGNVIVVHHRQNGLLSKTADANALAETLLKIMDDPQLYRVLSKGALEDSRQYSIEVCASAHLDLYRQVLEASSGKSVRKQV